MSTKGGGKRVLLDMVGTHRGNGFVFAQITLAFLSQMRRLIEGGAYSIKYGTRT